MESRTQPCIFSTFIFIFESIEIDQNPKIKAVDIYFTIEVYGKYTNFEFADLVCSR